MAVLSLLLILSCFPKERCRCRTDDVLLVAPALAHPGGGNGCSGRRHAAVEPDPLFQLCWYAAWRRVSPLDEMLFPVAGSCIRSSPLRTAEPPASAWWAVFVLFSWASPRDFPTVLRADPPTGEPHRDQVLVLITGRAKIVHSVLLSCCAKTPLLMASFHAECSLHRKKKKEKKNLQTSWANSFPGAPSLSQQGCGINTCPIVRVG